jgi:hypothetical protein
MYHFALLVFRRPVATPFAGVPSVFLIKRGWSDGTPARGVATGHRPIHFLLCWLLIKGDSGFAEYLTSEPNIRMDPANILVARIGRRLEEENINWFFERLLRSETLPGL